MDCLTSKPTHRDKWLARASLREIDLALGHVRPVVTYQRVADDLAQFILKRQQLAQEAMVRGKIPIGPSAVDLHTAQTRFWNDVLGVYQDCCLVMETIWRRGRFYVAREYGYGGRHDRAPVQNLNFYRDFAPAVRHLERHGLVRLVRDGRDQYLVEAQSPVSDSGTVQQT